MQRKLEFNLKTNSVVWGDNLHWLPHVPKKSIKFIFIDPPWNKDKKFEMIWGNGHEERAFEDRKKGGLLHYIGWMKKRLIIAHKTLLPEGSIMLQCDSGSNYKIRDVLNDIFGSNNFINEIVWKKTNSTKSQSNELGDQISTIFHYAKDKNSYKSKNIYGDMEKEEIEKRFCLEDKKGRYETQPLKAYGTLNGKNRKVFEFKGRKEPWLYTLDNLKELDKKGMITKTFRLKRYATDFDNKKIIGNIWTDVTLLKKKEKKGYPTQKPLSLLERCIDLTTDNENDVVLDFFGGGGTTAAACINKNRKFIIGDVSPVACRVIIDESIKKNGCNNFEVKQYPKTQDDWNKIDGHKFAKMICEFKGWQCNPKKSGDNGIDGWSKDNILAVQIKNYKKSLSVNHVKNFVASLSNYNKGEMVSWEFSHKAYDYVEIAKKEFKKQITLTPAHKILGELVLTKEEREKYEKLYEKAIKKSNYKNKSATKKNLYEFQIIQPNQSHTNKHKESPKRKKRSQKKQDQLQLSDY